MAPYQNLILSQRDRTRTIEVMRDALKIMDRIMADPLIADQGGYAWTTTDLDILQAGKQALQRWKPDTHGREQMLLNETLLEQIGRAVRQADYMVRRGGFYDVMSEGSTTLEGDAFNRADRERVGEAWEKYQTMTARSRN